ncbi:L-rhamnose mutarotase [Caballeronia mineralivorans PML1(12)]|uniref:L-rhamnose mutarotase n=1 Tax=Caballeronia mineralivorans PML1(12) TaxID=908627 RepID=A0A0J1CWJ4_9BURK|nr:L-rhamnose mutarotase [Caballeronia mineralivorans]KLU24945.1 L-rhamnose mutarotase [Caballeronia mineralivorans PML1(12)]
METIAFRMQLRPGQEEAYRARHDAIWPELAQTLRDAGIADYWIFFDDETHHLFAVLKRSADHTMDRLADEDVMKRWWAHMADLMATHPDRRPRQHSLKPMFHLA